jgi:hypothetical protein
VPLNEKYSNVVLLMYTAFPEQKLSTSCQEGSSFADQHTIHRAREGEKQKVETTLQCTDLHFTLLLWYHALPLSVVLGTNEYFS